ncbi:MAG TPA: Ig-like domain-containing protein [Polyangia bacterium]|nr:Ig-like domain-containing protein [Polyangia bacterium]
MLGCLGVAGCSQTTGETPYAGTCTPMDIVAWSPPSQAESVPTNSQLALTFSDYPDPDTVSVASLVVTSGPYRIPEAYRVDLLTRSVWMTPISLLSPDLGYSITVSPVLKSLAGCSGPRAHAEFTTGSGSAGTAPPAPPTFADIAPIFPARCAANCHADPDGGCLPAPAAGVSLCLAEARQALVNVPSRQLAKLVLVSPFSAARSYLMRKLIPGGPGGGPIPGTLGQREPPDEPLTADQLRAISDWIDGGALP